MPVCHLVHLTFELMCFTGTDIFTRMLELKPFTHFAKSCYLELPLLNTACTPSIGVYTLPITHLATLLCSTPT